MRQSPITKRKNIFLSLIFGVPNVSFLGNTFSTWTPSSLAKPGLSPSIPKIVKMTTPSSHLPLLHQETWRASRIRKFSGEKRDKNKTQQTHKDHPRHFERTTRVRWQRKNLRDVWLSCWKNGCKLFFQINLNAMLVSHLEEKLLEAS